MAWDNQTGEERVDPVGLKRPVKPRPGYTGVFKGPMPAPPMTPPSTYQRPGGGLFGLGQVGGGAPPMPRSVPGGLPFPVAGTPMAPGPAGLPKPPSPSPALPGLGGMVGGGARPQVQDKWGRSPSNPEYGRPPAGEQQEPIGAGLPPTDEEMAQKYGPMVGGIFGGGMKPGPPNLGQTVAASRPTMPMRGDPREALLRQLMLG